MTLEIFSKKYKYSLILNLRWKIDFFLECQLELTDNSCIFAGICTAHPDSRIS